VLAWADVVPRSNRFRVVDPDGKVRAAPPGEEITPDEVPWRRLTPIRTALAGMLDGQRARIARRQREVQPAQASANA
jgi:hypothetical protein